MKKQRFGRLAAISGMVAGLALVASTAQAQHLSVAGGWEDPRNMSQPRDGGDGGESPYEVVATGLNNPRGITIGRSGTIYVAEAGRGGEGPCLEGPEGNVCYGPTGAVTRIRDGEQERIVDDLPSLASEDGSGATGPHDVALDKGTVYTVVGLGNNPEARDELGDVGENFGQVVRLNRDGTWDARDDLAGYEADNDPDGAGPDSNPYSLRVIKGKRVVADAGGNTLVQVTETDTFKTLAVFPTREVPFPELPQAPPDAPPPGTPIPMQSVPTSLVPGPNGSYFVGELTGFPFPVGGARVYKVTRGDTTPDVYAEGFTNIVDVAYSKGNLYVLELFSKGLLQAQGPDADITGRLVEVAPDGTQTTIASDGLNAPGGMAIGPDGAIYVSTFSILPEQGQVVRIELEDTGK